MGTPKHLLLPRQAKKKKKEKNFSDFSPIWEGFTKRGGGGGEKKNHQPTS